MLRAVQMTPGDGYGCIFSWSTIQIKAFERKQENAFILQEIFELRFLF